MQNIYRSLYQPELHENPPKITLKTVGITSDLRHILFLFVINSGIIAIMIATRLR